MAFELHVDQIRHCSSRHSGWARLGSRALLFPFEWQVCKMWQKPVPQRGAEVVSILWMGARALSQHALRLGLRLKEMVIKSRPLLADE